MENGEKTNKTEQTTENLAWQEMAEELQAGQETAESESPEDQLLRRAEILEEADKEKLVKLTDDASKIASEVDIFSRKKYVSDEALRDFEAFLLPPESTSETPETLKRAIDNYQGEGRSAGAVREFKIKAALDYFEIRRDAERGLEQYIASKGENMSDVEAEGIEEIARLLRPQAGDDFSRMQMTASLFADGKYVSPKSFMRGSLRADAGRQSRGEKRREARVRDLGNFAILKQKVAEANGSESLAETSAVDMLQQIESSSKTEDFFIFINPLRLDYDRMHQGNWSRLLVENSRATYADVSGLTKMLTAFENQADLNSRALAVYYNVDELLEMSDQETDNISNFIATAGANIAESQTTGQVRNRLTDVSHALIGEKTISGDARQAGAMLRMGEGDAAKDYFDLALRTATVGEGDESLRERKLRIMANMLYCGMAEPGQTDGLEHNLFPAMDAGDERALSIAQDLLLEDGSPNPDADKNWTRGFGLGVADYLTACYVQSATPRHIHELIMQHDSLPGLNKERFFQNREDARVLATDDNNGEENSIFYSRDFIHNQMPHAHEVLVYQWAYQKIGRGEAFSDEERKMFAQIGQTAPAEGLNETDRKELLDNLGQEYLAFLEKNPELTEVILGYPGFYIKNEDLAEGESRDNLSPEKIHLAHERALQKFAFDLEKYDHEVELLDTASNTTVKEKVSDVLWRLVKNTDSMTIEAPKTGDSELDAMLEKLDLSVNEQGDCPIELRDLQKIMPAVNEKLKAMQNKREMNPQLIDGLSYISRAANYALKDIDAKELRELFYDPTFKEIVRFHSLTWQEGPYSEGDFESVWRKFSQIDMDADDQERIEHYAILNRMILNQSESLVQMYNRRATAVSESVAAERAKIDADRYEDVAGDVTDPYFRGVYQASVRADEHSRQEGLYKNFANSVWSMNLSSTLAKIGFELTK